MLFRLQYFAALFPLLAQAAVPGHYIVEMADDPVAVYVAQHTTLHTAQGGIRGTAAMRQRARIRERQRPVRTRLEAAGAEVLDSVDTVINAFIVRIPEANASRLASISGIIHVYPVRKFQLH